MYDEFINTLFGKRRRFHRITTKSLIITVALFIAIDQFSNIIDHDFVLIMFALVVFFVIFAVYFNQDVYKK